MKLKNNEPQPERMRAKRRMSREKDIGSEEQKYGPKGNKGKPKGSICVSVPYIWSVCIICVLGCGEDFGVYSCFWGGGLRSGERELR